MGYYSNLDLERKEFWRKVKATICIFFGHKMVHEKVMSACREVITYLHCERCGRHW